MFLKNEHFGTARFPDWGALGEPGAIVLLLLGGALAAIVLGWLLARIVTRSLRRRSDRPANLPRPLPSRRFFSRREMWKPEVQAEAVALADFETAPLLNHSEKRLLPLLEDAVAREAPGFRVMAQTSMGEVLRPRPIPARRDLQDAAFAAINSKRFDFTIIDRRGYLVAAIEYQGSGHYAQTAFLRDAVKREVCRKAGVAFIEVRKGMRPSELAETLRRVLQPHARRRGAAPAKSADAPAAARVIPYPSAPASD